MTDAQKQELIDALNKKVSHIKCPICNHDQFIMAEGYTISLLQQDLKNMKLGGQNIPSGTIVCAQCGFMMSFALGVLGLLHKEKPEEDTIKQQGGANITQDYQVFYDSLLDPNYHDIYDLHEVASGKDSPFGFFEIQPNYRGNDALIKSTLNNGGLSLLLPLEKRQEFLDWIEKNLMHGMDAESYYGWEYNMEHDNDKD